MKKMITINKLAFQYSAIENFKLQIDKFEIKDKDKICLIGPSGSGKTTFLNLISGIYKPIEGSIVVNGINITSKNEKDIREFRLKNIGYIFQDFGLIDYLTVEYNILLPFYLSSKLNLSKAIEERLVFLLNTLNIWHKRKSYIKEMSEGERQRVAIARAMINNPSILIADEPTGNLDVKTTKVIMDLLSKIVTENKSTFICATHNRSLFKYFDKVIDIQKLNKG